MSGRLVGERLRQWKVELLLFFAWYILRAISIQHIGDILCVGKYSCENLSRLGSKDLFFHLLVAARSFLFVTCPLDSLNLPVAQGQGPAREELQQSLQAHVYWVQWWDVVRGETGEIGKTDECFAFFSAFHVVLSKYWRGSIYNTAIILFM